MVAEHAIMARSLLVAVEGLCFSEREERKSALENKEEEEEEWRKRPACRRHKAA